MAYAIQSSFSYHMGILPWTRFLSKMDGWLTIQIFVKVKLHFFISWHMTFKAHFHNTGASYHNQFPFKNVWPWKCFNCTLLLWPLWYIFQGQIALLYFMTWHSKLIFITQMHLTTDQIPFENGILSSYSKHPSTLQWVRSLSKMGDIENVLIVFYRCDLRDLEIVLIALYYYCDLLKLESVFWHCQMIWRSVLPYHGPNLFSKWVGQIALYLFISCDTGLYWPRGILHIVHSCSYGESWP